jgi:predicted transposase YbfD/YdcC
MNMQELAEKLKEVADPRRSWGNKRHKLEDIIIIGLCTLICGGEDFTYMEELGKERFDVLSQFLELPNGIPDSDTFRRVFEKINPAELSKVLYDWLGVEHEKRCVVAIDGKTICGSKNNDHNAYHVVSAFVVENQLTLGELCVAEKSNEITAVPELLDLIDIEGAIVTADAMSCQKAIVEKITDKNADFCISLKGNQSNFHDDVRLYFENFKTENLQMPIEKGHGRIENRTYFLETNIDWLFQKDGWKGLKSIGAVKSTVFEKGETHTETRYFISSLTDISEFADSVRKHWSIENNLHWSLDVIFCEDAARNRKDNSPLNMNVLRKVALFLLSNANFGKSRLSRKKKMFAAAMNPDKMLSALFGLK